MDFEKLLKKDRYQVFLLACPAVFPLNFATHPWFVVNKKGAVSRWEVLWRVVPHETSWEHLYKNIYADPWRGIEMFTHSHKHIWESKLLGVVEGDEGSAAARMAELIESSPQAYPHPRDYSLRGPNSNTYAQWVLNKFPESGLTLPWNAFGKNA